MASFLLTSSITLLACDPGSTIGKATGGGNGATSSSTGSETGSSTGSSTSSGSMPMLDGPDICGFTAAVDPGAKGADGLVEISPRHPLIRYGGRIDCSATDGPAFAWPGVSIQVRFKGDALDMRLRDFGTGGETATNYYNVIVDNAAPTVVQVSPAQEVYELARNLAAGEHTVEIQKRVESAPGGSGGAGKGQLLGLRVREGTELVAIPASSRKIEFLGDSITCGYGNEVSTMMPDMAHYTSKAENAWLAYGAVTARNLGYEYMAVSYSGRGMYRNYAGGAGEALPGLYLRTFPDDAAGPMWDVQRYQPDVVVINLGTNDFSPGGVDRQQYRTAYLDFLTKIRGFYANAAIIAAVGPMLSDFFPPGEMAWTNVQADVQTVVQQRKDAGDIRVYYFAFSPQTGPWGEDYHPTVATHADMAAKLTDFINNTVKP